MLWLVEAAAATAAVALALAEVTVETAKEVNEVPWVVVAGFVYTSGSGSGSGICIGGLCQWR